MLDKHRHIPCKICGSETTILGSKDFNKACESENSRVFPPSELQIYYHQCTNCQFIFTIDFDGWTKEAFLEKIYNDEYIKVDPEYVSIRPTRCVDSIITRLRGNKSLSILDYGAGTNVFSDKLRSHGFNAEGWDPMWETASIPENKHFDIITAFEVLEHTPTPVETTKEIVSFLKPESGKIIISTLVSNISGFNGIQYWYIGPRNGHVCMHSNRSLDVMFDQVGMKISHDSISEHVVTWK